MIEYNELKKRLEGAKEATSTPTDEAVLWAEREAQMLAYHAARAAEDRVRVQFGLSVVRPSAAARLEVEQAYIRREAQHRALESAHPVIRWLYDHNILRFKDEDLHLQG